MEHCRTTRGNLLASRWHVLRRVSEWLQIPDMLDLYLDEIQRNQLVSLLYKGTKHTKQLPQDDAEWSRLLTFWIRQNRVEDRLIYHILAVDGFDGFEPKDLKYYLPAVIDPGCIRWEYRQHGIAVRSMYQWFESHSDVSSLTGSDSGCVVFLALLQLYVEEIPPVDEQIAMQAHRAQAWAEGYLYRNASNHQDVRKVTPDLLRELGRVYGNAWDWHQVAREQLASLINKKWFD